MMTPGLVDECVKRAPKKPCESSKARQQSSHPSATETKKQVASKAMQGEQIDEIESAESSSSKQDRREGLRCGASEPELVWLRAQAAAGAGSIGRMWRGDPHKHKKA